MTAAGPASGSNGARVGYHVLPDASAVLIQARSTVGPIELASTSVSGRVEATVHARQLDLREPPAATLTLPVDSLRSGNPLYDSEIRRRLDAQRFPSIVAELDTTTRAADASLSVTGRLTIHGRSRVLSGTAQVVQLDDLGMQVVGEQLVDIRDFGISLPTALMMRVFPDVLVRFRIEGARQPPADAEQG